MLRWPRNTGYGATARFPPPVILKLMLLWVLYHVRSERELMETIPERLDWGWVLGYDLNTHRSATTVVADSKYGTVENFFACHDRGLHAPMPDLGEAAAKRSVKRRIFPEAAFPMEALLPTRWRL